MMKSFMNVLFLTMLFSTAEAATYSIEVTNLTKGQHFSPPLIAIHNKKYDFIKNGMPATAGVMLLAEDGNPIIWNRELQSQKRVKKSTTGVGLTEAGTSRVFEIDVTKTSRNNRISVALMLVTTNDGLSVIEGKKLPKKIGKSISYMSTEYDSGTEYNNEIAETIPLPANNFHVRDFEKAEGYISRHKGILGKGDYTKEQYGWGKSASKVKITRIR